MLPCQNCDFGKHRLSVAKLSVLHIAAKTSIHALVVSCKLMIWRKIGIISLLNGKFEWITFNLQTFTLTSEISFARRATFTWISTSNKSGATRSGVRSTLICSKHWLMSLWTTLKNMSIHHSMQSAFDFAAAHNRIVWMEWSFIGKSYDFWFESIEMGKNNEISNCHTKTMQYCNLLHNRQFIRNCAVLIAIVGKCGECVQKFTPYSTSCCGAF